VQDCTAAASAELRQNGMDRRRPFIHCFNLVAEDTLLPSFP
jgi:hypothetical protein